MRRAGILCMSLVFGCVAMLGGCRSQPELSPATLRQMSTAINNSPMPAGRDRMALSDRMIEFLNNGQFHEAIGAANRVIKNGGASVGKAYYVRGSAEGQMSEFGLAVEDLRVATKLSPETEEAWLNRAWYEYELGDVNQAIKTGEKAVTLYPRLSIVWLNLGLAHAVKNNMRESKRCYDAGRRLANRGVIAAAMRDIDNALERYPKSTKSLNQAMAWLTGD